MSTPEQAVSPENGYGATDETIRRWDLSIIKEHVKRIWAAMQGREDRGPVDFDPFADERRFYQRLLQEQRRGDHGHGNVGNGTSKAAWLVFGGLITLNVAAIGWFAQSLIEVRQDVAVIKCQLSPDCKKVLTSGSP